MEYEVLGHTFYVRYKPGALTTVDLEEYKERVKLFKITNNKEESTLEPGEYSFGQFKLNLVKISKDGEYPEKYTVERDFFGSPLALYKDDDSFTLTNDINTLILEHWDCLASKEKQIYFRLCYAPYNSRLSADKYIFMKNYLKNQSVSCKLPTFIDNVEFLTEKEPIITVGDTVSIKLVQRKYKKFMTKSIYDKEAKNIIENWYNKTLKELKKFSEEGYEFGLSGGQDSRLLAKMLVESTDNYKIYSFKKKQKTRSSEEKIIRKVHKLLNIKADIIDNPLATKRFSKASLIQGSGTEHIRTYMYCKYDKHNNIIFTNDDKIKIAKKVRWYWIDSANNSFLYFRPFLSDDLASFYDVEPGLIHAILYTYFHPELLNVPFCSAGGEEYFLDEALLDKAKKIIKGWQTI